MTIPSVFATSKRPGGPLTASCRQRVFYAFLAARSRRRRIEARTRPVALNSGIDVGFLLRPHRNRAASPVAATTRILPSGEGASMGRGSASPTRSREWRSLSRPTCRAAGQASHTRRDARAAAGPGSRAAAASAAGPGSPAAAASSASAAGPGLHAAAASAAAVPGSRAVAASVAAVPGSRAAAVVRPRRPASAGRRLDRLV